MSSSSTSNDCISCTLDCEGDASKIRTITKVWRSEDEGNILRCDPWKKPEKTTAYYWNCEFNDSKCKVSIKCDKPTNKEAEREAAEKACSELDGALAEKITDLLGDSPTCDANFTPDLKEGDEFEASMKFHMLLEVYKPVGCQAPWATIVPLGGIQVTRK